MIFAIKKNCWLSILFKGPCQFHRVSFPALFRMLTFEFSVTNTIFLPSQGQIKDAVLGGVALEDEQREKFNQIQQVGS